MKKDGDFIEIYKNAISNETCDYMVEAMESNSESTYPGATASGTMPKIKKSTDFNLLDARKSDSNIDSVIIPTLRKSLYKHLLEYFIKYPFLHTELFLIDEGLQEVLDKGDDKTAIQKIFKRVAFWPASILIKRYTKEVDGYHGWHEDNGNDTPEICRMLVFMYYLNDVEEGGETDFLHQNLKIKPTKGSLVIFPTYFTHTHKGHIPISNDKYICNVWLMKRSKAFDGIATEINNYYATLN
tara:strand:- start:324 stop:1046 length:723 start_codon:yes stop_codon:yes gene_type:complete